MHNFEAHALHKSKKQDEIPTYKDKNLHLEI